MKKILTLILILGLIYLAYIAIFTDEPSICETMINLTDGVKNQNQYVTYTDKDKNDYVMIRLNDIKDSTGQPNRKFISEVYERISKIIPDYDKLVGQDTKQVIESLEKGSTQIIREPIVAIKAVDAVKLTRNTLISVSVRDLGEGDKKKTILIPHSSRLEGTKLEGNTIKGRIIQLDKILFLDQDSKDASSIFELNKLFLQEIIQFDGVKVYVLKADGEGQNEINLL
jgi:hypothetical protein